MTEIPGFDKAKVCRTFQTMASILSEKSLIPAHESCLSLRCFAEFVVALDVFQVRVFGFRPDVIIMAGESSSFGVNVMDILGIKTPVAIVDKVPLYQWTADPDIVLSGGDDRKKNRVENRRMAGSFGGMVIQQARSQTGIDIDTNTRILVVDDHVRRGWKTAVSLATLCYALNPFVDLEDDHCNPAIANAAFAAFAVSEEYYWQIVESQRVFVSRCDYDGQAIIPAMGVFGDTLSRSVDPGILGLYPPDLWTTLLAGVLSTPATNMAWLMGEVAKVINEGGEHSDELRTAYEFIMGQIKASFSA